MITTMGYVSCMYSQLGIGFPPNTSLELQNLLAKFYILSFLRLAARKQDYNINTTYSSLLGIVTLEWHSIGSTRAILHTFEWNV